MIGKNARLCGSMCIGYEEEALEQKKQDVRRELEEEYEEKSNQLDIKYKEDLIRLEKEVEDRYKRKIFFLFYFLYKLFENFSKSIDAILPKKKPEPEPEPEPEWETSTVDPPIIDEGFLRKPLIDGFDSPGVIEPVLKKSENVGSIEDLLKQLSKMNDYYRDNKFENNEIIKLTENKPIPVPNYQERCDPPIKINNVEVIVDNKNYSRAPPTPSYPTTQTRTGNERTRQLTNNTIRMNPPSKRIILPPLKSNPKTIGMKTPNNMMSVVENLMFNERKVRDKLEYVKKINLDRKMEMAYKQIQFLTKTLFETKNNSDKLENMFKEFEKRMIRITKEDNIEVLEEEKINIEITDNEYIKKEEKCEKDEYDMIENV
jgi:hypothetical protein